MRISLYIMHAEVITTYLRFAYALLNVKIMHHIECVDFVIAHKSIQAPRGSFT